MVGQKLELELKTSSYSQGWEGTIVKYGTDTIQSGKFYNYTASGWIATRATSDASVKGLVGIALGSDADVDGLLVEGVYTSTTIFPTASFSAGDIVYLSTTSGAVTATAPSASGAFVRVIGYALGSGSVYINPSPDYIEIS